MDRQKQPMISCLILERPGKWRLVGVIILFLIGTLPALSLLWRVNLAAAPALVLGGTFSKGLLNSVLIAFMVALLSFSGGLPAGVLAALYDFPGRIILLAATTLPLLIPSFLWAIGWSSLAAYLNPTATRMISGISGCALIFCAATVPLVLLVCYAACSALSGSQVDAARLAGGETTVFKQACRHAFVPALLASGLGGVLTLSDPGPGQILGLQTAASEILTSFSALYDFNLAGRQCIVLTVLVLIFAVPLACFAAPRLVSQVMARQSQALCRTRRLWAVVFAIILFNLLILLETLIPLWGLSLPLREGQPFLRGLEFFRETALNSLLYAFGSGLIAAVLGLFLAFCAGRNKRLLVICIGALFAIFCFPPTLVALGIVQLSAWAPLWSDFILRGRLIVCLALGLRFFPVAAVIGLRAWGSMSASWTMAAGTHGISIGRYLRKVVFPLILPAVGVATLLTALLSSAEIGTVLLLHPPGQRSFPLSIFTVMANAPEALTASLCLIYVAVAITLLTLLWSMARRRGA